MSTEHQAASPSPRDDPREALGEAPRERADLGPLVVAARRLGVPLDERARVRFATYLELLAEWRPRAGLTSVEEPAAVQRRHFAESIALLPLLREREPLADGGPARLIDIGTGAGFPGLPLRIVEPRLKLTLLESHGRRCRFLEATTEALGFEDVEVICQRAEDAGRDAALREQFDVAVARALAPLNVLVEYALPLLRPGGILVAPKGSRALEELEAATAAIEALGGTAEEPRPLELPPGAPPQSVLLVRRTGALDDRYPRRAGVPAKRPLG